MIRRIFHVGLFLAGLFGRMLGRTLSHVVTILGVLVSLLASITVLRDTLAKIGGLESPDHPDWG